MQLTAPEQAMLDGAHGPAKQKAMELLVRYGEALGAERFVDTNNVTGVPGSSTLFLQSYYRQRGIEANYEALYSLFDLHSDEGVLLPKEKTSASHLQSAMNPQPWLCKR